MAKKTAKNIILPGIAKRSSASDAVKKENKAIANRPKGWTAKEAQKASQRKNTLEVKGVTRR